MNFLMIIIYIWVAVILWFLVTWLIRYLVNEKNKHAPILVKHDYTENVFYQIWMVFWHYRIMQRSLVCNMTMKLASVKKEPMDVQSLTTADSPQYPTIRDEQIMVREEYWTNAKASEIKRRGYKTVERLHDSIWWVRVPRYLQVAGAIKFETPKTINPKTGTYDYPQHTPSILADRFQSRASDKFKKMMAKQTVRQLDSHMIMMMAILAVGCIAGMWLLGII